MPVKLSSEHPCKYLIEFTRPIWGGGGAYEGRKEGRKEGNEARPVSFPEQIFVGVCIRGGSARRGIIAALTLENTRDYIGD